MIFKHLFYSHTITIYKTDIFYNLEGQSVYRLTENKKKYYNLNKSYIVLTCKITNIASLIRRNCSIDPDLKKVKVLNHRKIFSKQINNIEI